MPDVEVAIGSKDIMKMLGWSPSKFYRRRQELMDMGVIFYRMALKPPRPNIYAFPSRIHKYVAVKARKGEVL